MRFAYLIKKRHLASDPQIAGLLKELEEGGAEVYNVADTLKEGTDLLLSFGGDGTFIIASRYVCKAGIPILGINMGRLGFLSDTKIEGLAPILLAGGWKVEQRQMLQLTTPVPDGEDWPYAVNEISVFRAEAAMLGVDVNIAEGKLPTIWADGVLVSTSSGSTAYALSAGGPICTPDLSAFTIVPVAPHNLNVRPLVFPGRNKVSLKPHTRHNAPVLLTLDNRTYKVSAETVISVEPAPFCLKRATVGESTFIDALRSKLFWGEDVRNR